MSAKDKICSAALGLFVENGYHQTSIPDIVKAANVSTGALYHHYESKEELARYIHKCVTDTFLEKYEQNVKPLEGFEKKIHAFVRMMLEWHNEMPMVVKYLTTARPKEVLNRKSTICSEEGIKVIGEIITEGLIAQEVITGDYFLAAAVISGSIIQYLNLKTDGFVESDLEKAIGELSKIICRALLK